MKGYIKELKNKIVPVLKRYDVVRAAVFGSFVRGEMKKDSDIDLLIEFEEISGRKVCRKIYYKEARKMLLMVICDAVAEGKRWLKRGYLNSSLSSTSLVLSTSTNPVLSMNSLSSLSFDHTAQLHALANAVNGKSLIGDFSLASSSQGSNSAFGITSIFSCSISKNFSISSLERCVFFSNISSYFLNSSNNLSGAIRYSLSESRSFALTPSFIVAANSMLESTTRVNANTIYLPLYQAASFLFSSLPDLIDSSSVISDSEAKYLMKANFSNFSSTAFLATADQLTSGNFLILSSKSLGNTNSAISITDNNISEGSLNNYRLMKDGNVYDNEQAMWYWEEWQKKEVEK